MKFQLLKDSLENHNVRREFVSNQAGAFCSFEGLVRDHNDGKDVVALEYEAHEELCKKEADKIFQEVKEKFDIVTAKCIHRIGRLQVGETAVWVGVTAVHRDDAFMACKYIIDEIKARLTIWKKEYYQNGDSGWVNCQHCLPVSEEKQFRQSPEEFYSRQITLEEIGDQGQKKLENAKILVVGAGGLGCSALTSLVGAGVGVIGISECDLLEESNLHRQFLYEHKDIGRPKVELAARHLQARNPYIKIDQYPQRLNPSNVEQIIKNYDVILDCTDNFKTKFLLNDAAVLNKKLLVHSSIYRFEGQLRVIRPFKTGCLRCLWPDIPHPGCVGTCAEVGVLGVIPSVFGHLQAIEAVKLLLNFGTHDGETIIFDFCTYNVLRVKQSLNPSCPLCGQKPEITGIKASNYEEQLPFVINIAHLPLEELERYYLIDIREPAECMEVPIHEMECIPFPLSRFDDENFAFDRQKRYILLCAKGVRSSQLAQRLQDSGILNVFSLAGGVDSIKRYFQNKKRKEFNVTASERL